MLIYFLFREDVPYRGRCDSKAVALLELVGGSVMSTVKAIVLAAVLFLSGFSPAYVNQAQRFHSEQEAKQHCPNDTVVWVNTKTGVYHFKGEWWYGATKEGSYECRKEADAEGDRATRNGQ
jgi:hypothetical protein